MFLFYHTNQIPKNKSYYKGILFEKLLKKFLYAQGFDVELRIRENGVEYDIDGKHRTAGFKIIGEAKAYQEKDKITIPIFSSFIGKFNPLGIDKSDKRGLFLSISHLTPEAKEWYRSIKEKNDCINVITGEELFDNIKKQFNLVVSHKLLNKLKNLKYVKSADKILISDLGNFLVLICSSSESANPSFFLLINENGDELSYDDFISRIKQNVKELKDLTYINLYDKIDLKFEKKIEKGLVVGKDWFDYRLPAGPQYFIGRESICKEIYEHIESTQQSNIIQIKSRSGEGKSSLLSFLEMNFSLKNIHTELHDARNIKTINNVFYIVQRFTQSNFFPKNYEEVEKQIDDLFNNQNINKAVLMIDQFESTFLYPDIFDAYENLINIIYNYKSKLFVIITRKSDQLTTYDETKISLDRIKSLSITKELVDFEPIEAKTLIEKVNEDSKNRISREVKEYALGLASGFPYALRSVMAHIIKMIRKGLTEKELLDRNFKLEDLFEEELRELEENEKGFLKRIAKFLPATIDELESTHSENRNLRKYLNKLTSEKLLRSLDGKYDIYNDVFKEYLITGKIPEYSPLIIYRISPYTILKLFHGLIIRKNTVYSIEDVQEFMEIKAGYSKTLINELTNLNLLKSVDKFWEIPETAREFYRANKLGEYIRSQLLTNNLVIKLKNRMEIKEKVSTQSLPIFLSEQFPFQETAPSERTWMTYSNFLINWLKITKVILIDSNDDLSIPTKDSQKIIEELGNLTEYKYKTDVFLPSSTFKNIEDCFLAIQSDISFIKFADYTTLLDLKKTGWLNNNILTIRNLEELRAKAVELITTENHNKIWEAARNGEILLKKFKEIFGESYADQTNKVMLSKLKNWGKSLGIIPYKNYKNIEGKYTSPKELIAHRKLQSESIWETHYKELEDFIINNKHSSIPRSGKTKTLGHWATRMRTMRKRRILPEEKIDLLNQIGFDWDPVKNTWDRRYRDLLKFKEKYEHTHVPKDYDEKLHFWVKNQRMNIYQDKLSPEKKELLIKIGILDKYNSIEFEPIPKHTMNLLQEFYKENGHINVPQLDKEYKNLGRWINDQRIQKKRGKLKKERETILEEMGIVWNVKEFNWDKKLNELKSFYKQNGHFNVTRQNSNNRSLGKWLYDLKRKRPSGEKLKKLLSIGFDWKKERL